MGKHFCADRDKPLENVANSKTFPDCILSLGQESPIKFIFHTRLALISPFRMSFQTYIQGSHFYNFNNICNWRGTGSYIFTPIH